MAAIISIYESDLKIQIQTALENDELFQQVVENQQEEQIDHANTKFSDHGRSLLDI